MKDTLIAITIIFGVCAFALLTIPWVAEYVEMYFTWVRSHFTH